MENNKKKLLLKDSLDGLGTYSSSTYYRSSDGRTIAVYTNCECCGKSYYHKWTVDELNCLPCAKVKELTKRVEELEVQNKNWQEIHEEYLDKAQNWHQNQLDQKDKETTDWKNRAIKAEKKLKEMKIDLDENEKFNFSVEVNEKGMNQK